MATHKGIARVPANIKPMAGGNTIATVPVDGWVFGNLSPTGSDLIDVTDWYRPSGQKMPLVVPCKVSIANLTVKPYMEPPPVDEPPPNEEEPPGEEEPSLPSYDFVRQTRMGVPQANGQIDWEPWEWEGIKILTGDESMT